MIAAEATVTKLEPARKIYVLDTNVLLHDPTAITFAEHQVVIPMTVLEELDHIKDRRDKSVSREARIAIQLIDKVVSNASPQEIQSGVDIPALISMNIAWVARDFPRPTDCRRCGSPVPEHE